MAAGFLARWRGRPVNPGHARTASRQSLHIFRRLILTDGQSQHHTRSSLGTRIQRAHGGRWACCSLARATSWKRLPTWRLDPAATVAPSACLLPQATMLWHLTLTITLRTVGVRWVQRVYLANGFQLELGHVAVDHHELLLVEQNAVGETQLVDVALRPASPRPKVAHCDR